MNKQHEEKNMQINEQCSLLVVLSYNVKGPKQLKKTVAIILVWVVIYSNGYLVQSFTAKVNCLTPNHGSNYCHVYCTADKVKRSLNSEISFRMIFIALLKSNKARCSTRFRSCFQLFCAFLSLGNVHIVYSMHLQTRMLRNIEN